MRKVSCCASFVFAENDLRFLYQNPHYSIRYPIKQKAIFKYHSSSKGRCLHTLVQGVPFISTWPLHRLECDYPNLSHQLRLRYALTIRIRFHSHWKGRGLTYSFDESVIMLAYQQVYSFKCSNRRNQAGRSRKLCYAWSSTNVLRGWYMERWAWYKSNIHSQGLTFIAVVLYRIPCLHLTAF